MIGFILFSIALLVMVMWLIAPALLGKQEQIIDSTKQTNVSIAREKLAELEAQLAQGDITQAQYDQSHDEIEFALLDDTDDDTDTGETTVGELPVSYRRYIFVLLTAIPFIAFGLYQYWGEPDAITGIAPIAATQGQQAPPEHAVSMEEALAILEAKLEKNPDNPDGWYTLARTYMVQKQYENAARAFRRLQSLVGDHAVILLGLADALTMSRNGDMRGEPFELAKRALKLEPNNTTALWLTGLGHQDNGDLKSALRLWKKLLPLLTEDPQSAHQVKTLIDQANRQLGIAVTNAPLTPPKPAETTTATSEASLTVQVKLDPALRARISDTDYVMVYAQRVDGMKMPLAMIRLQIKDLPATIKLDDSTSLSPVNKLSGEQQVYVIARITKSSQAAKQAGDIEKKMGPYPVAGSAPVTIILGP